VLNITVVRLYDNFGLIFKVSADMVASAHWKLKTSLQTMVWPTLIAHQSTVGRVPHTLSIVWSRLTAWFVSYRHVIPLQTVW